MKILTKRSFRDTIFRVSVGFLKYLMKHIVSYHISLKIFYCKVLLSLDDSKTRGILMLTVRMVCFSTKKTLSFQSVVNYMPVDEHFF